MKKSKYLLPTDEEMEEILKSTTTVEEAMDKKLRYHKNRLYLKFIIVVLIKEGAISTAHFKNKFRMGVDQARKMLNDYSGGRFPFLKKGNVEGSHLVVYKPLVGDDNEPVIYKYYAMCKEKEGNLIYDGDETDEKK